MSRRLMLDTDIFSYCDKQHLALLKGAGAEDRKLDFGRNQVERKLTERRLKDLYRSRHQRRLASPRGAATLLSPQNWSGSCAGWAT